MSPPDLIRIATRASQLALWQANHVAGLLQAASPGCIVELVQVSTIGDRDQKESLQSFGGFGVFTREVQRAVLDQRADLAVHSLKDLPTEPAEGLYLAAVPPRADVDDALLFPASKPELTNLDSLAPGAVVGTGSVRRQSQLRHLRPDLQLKEVRGNVETRLRKLDDGEYDALVLAVAGLTRLGFEGRIRQRLSPPIMFPAVGQGALGLECRVDDEPLRQLLSQIEDPATRQRVDAERAVLRHLQAGCHAPVGVRTSFEQGQLVLEAVVLSPDGTTRLLATGSASPATANELGITVAEDLLSQGAETFISG